MIMPPLLLVHLLAAASAPPPSAEKPPLLVALEEELERSHTGLRTGDGVGPYYIAYEVSDQTQVRLDASWGTLVHDVSHRGRVLDIDLRVGDYQVDSTHELRGEGGGSRDAGQAASLPIEDEPLALRQVIWKATDERFKQAVERLSRVKASMAVKVDPADKSADFSPRVPIVDIRKGASISVDRAAWGERLRALSRVFLESAEIYDASVSLDVSSSNDYFVSSEGSRLSYGDNEVRLSVYAATRADDGMELLRYQGWEARDLEGLPEPKEVEATARRLMKDLEALRRAPLVEPSTVPAILSGRASAVFFHEIFGHRIEGHRQKSEDEGQTFTRRVGKPVLPPFLSVRDDPTLMRFGDRELMGYYPYDNEGVPAQSVEVVGHGTLRSFLMSRSPVAGFSESNGHGRRQAGYPPVGRQGNLVVTSDSRLTTAELRTRLKDLIRRQRKPFGLYFEDISGGFTFTQRAEPQAYKVLPLMVYRVYPDDRPDELVRGVDIVGTPLASFAKIVAAGGEPEVFNGYCGAESGYVPVSAVAPSVLVSEMEVEKRSKGVDRPPILEPPTLRQGDAR